MRRVAVVGTSGAGKTTAGRRLATSLGVDFVELDGIFHQPDWQPLPTDELRALVGHVASDDGWVIDGNYAAIRDLVWGRADTVVWLDLPRRVVMRRVILRTLRRVLTRQQLWNGNREPFSNLYRWDPETNIVRWAWTRYPEYAQQYSAATSDVQYAHIRFVRLTSTREVEAFLRAPVLGAHGR
jgi:adenylate kinase family enzyme